MRFYRVHKRSFSEAESWAPDPTEKGSGCGEGAWAPRRQVSSQAPGEAAVTVGWRARVWGRSTAAARNPAPPHAPRSPGLPEGLRASGLHVRTNVRRVYFPSQGLLGRADGGRGGMEVTGPLDVGTTARRKSSGPDSGLAWREPTVEKRLLSARGRSLLTGRARPDLRCPSGHLGVS